MFQVSPCPVVTRCSQERDYQMPESHQAAALDEEQQQLSCKVPPWLQSSSSCHDKLGPLPYRETSFQPLVYVVTFSFGHHSEPCFITPILFHSLRITFCCPLTLFPWLTERHRGKKATGAHSWDYSVRLQYPSICSAWYSGAAMICVCLCMWAWLCVALINDVTQMQSRFISFW